MSKQHKKPQEGQIERRFFPGKVQIRMESTEGEEQEKRTVEGYAAVFNEETDMYWWKERIAPGAFSDALKDDVRALFNHDPNFILARSNNTLELWEDEKGLGYRFETPNTTIGNDLLENLRNGNITQSSFGFTIETYEVQEREEGDDLITITKIGRLYDVSPVTFPAYEATEVTARSIDKIREEIKQKREAEQENKGEQEGNEGPDDTGENDENSNSDEGMQEVTSVTEDIEYYKLNLVEKE